MNDQPMDNTAAAALDEIPRSYDHAVRSLAAAHAAGLDDVTIYLVSDPNQRVVRLIEVSAAFPEGGVERPVSPDRMERIVPVFPMGSAKDFPFGSEIVQVTPAEWDQLLEGKLKLNRDWGDLRAARKVTDGE